MEHSTPRGGRRTTLTRSTGGVCDFCSTNFMVQLFPMGEVLGVLADHMASAIVFVDLARIEELKG